LTRADRGLAYALRLTYERSDLIEQAVLGARVRAEGLKDKHEQELAFTDTESAKATEAIERYLGAFEAGTLTEAQCGTRLSKLGTKVSDLRSRREELMTAMDQASAEVPTDAELTALRAHIDDALANGAIPARKALLQALVYEVRVESRDKVVPWFRVRGGEPKKVRALGGKSPPASQNANLDPVVEGPAIILPARHAELRREGHGQ
jgi:site-specific DNA recombinase